MVIQARRMVAVMGLALFALTGTPAVAKTDSQERVVERARLVLDSFLDDPTFQDMRVYVQNAYAVLIVPEVLKGGFVLGAEYGIGVLLVRNVDTGAWGQPAFYGLFAGSFGLQAGGQSSDVVLTIMNQGAVEKLMDNGVRLGGNMSIAVGRLGGGIGAGTTTHFGEDVYMFAKSQGLYGGLALEGAMVFPKDDWNQAYYGRPLTPREIVRTLSAEQVVAAAPVVALHESLTQF
jgi:lipid-binding SYLF domain-containing protein